MAKKQKESVEAQADNIAETEPVATSASVPPSKKLLETPEEAKEYVKQNYQVPEGVKVVTVTQDKKVFWPENSSSGHNHAIRNNLQIFTIPWD